MCTHTLPFLLDILDSCPHGIPCQDPDHRLFFPRHTREGFLREFPLGSPPVSRDAEEAPVNEDRDLNEQKSQGAFLGLQATQTSN